MFYASRNLEFALCLFVCKAFKSVCRFALDKQQSICFVCFVLFSAR